MKPNLLIVLIAVSVCALDAPVYSQETNSAKVELQELVQKVRAKLKDGNKSEADLAPELKQFDALLAEHKNEKTDDVAQILSMKAMLYVQVMDDPKKAVVLLNQLKRDFPDTKPGQNADRMIESVKEQEVAKEVQRSLVEGSTFPDFSAKDIQGGALSVANHKGKVVLLDFWATWCTPCVQELPNVIKTYDKYHAQGFDVIGISLDQQKSKLTSFLQEKNMTWPQYFDGKGWQNELALKYGIRSIPATFLLDGNGKIIGKDLRGEDLSEAVAKALAKK